MKKITFLLAALALNFSAMADTDLPANIYPDGEGVLHHVMYDCATGEILQTLPEVDQTFVLAVDITGSGLMDFMNNWTLSAPGTKGIALHFWSDPTEEQAAAGLSQVAGDVRLMHIKDNIYGATVNWRDLAHNGNISTPAFSPEFLAASKEPGAVLYIHALVVGFGYNSATPPNEGIDWWKVGLSPADGRADYDFGVIHIASAPYTGAYAESPMFWGDQDTDNPYIFNKGEAAGLAAPCADVPYGDTSIGNTVADDSPVVGYEYYNLQGQKLSAQPESGLYIEKAVRADGTFAVTKILK